MHDPVTYPAALQARLGYRFTDPALLCQALTHASYTNEHPQEPCYERLEFLGDAVVELLVTRHLYRAHPTWSEGRMTRTRAMVVSEPSLSAVALALEMHRGIRMGRGTRQLGAQQNPAVLCDVLEALVGALYLDGGMDTVQRIIMPLLQERLALAEAQGIHSGDYKTALQELLQKNGDIAIEYRLVGSDGPPHDMTFTVQLFAAGQPLATGSGKSKKQAQQQAARAALEYLEAKDK